jgi:NitT/TauT family transport system substrate-binding protein
VDLFAGGKPVGGADQAAMAYIICDPDSGVKTAKDLEGKTIMTTAGAGVNVFWPVVVANAGLDETKIKITNVAESALVPLYLKKQAPCILGGLDDKPAQIEANGGKPPVVISYTDYGVLQPGYVIAVHKDTVKENPEMVRRFVLATLQSVKAAQADPDASVAAMSNWSTLDEAQTLAARKVLDVTLSILWSPNNTDKVLGQNQIKDFEIAIDLFKKYLELKTDLTPDQFFTNEFVPATLP